MSNDDKRPGGDLMGWVDPDRKRPLNAFDEDDGWFGQAYWREREAQSGRRMPSGDVAGSKDAGEASAAAGEDSFDPDPHQDDAPAPKDGDSYQN